MPNKTVRFRSRFKDLQIPAPPEYSPRVVRGLRVLNRKPLQYHTFSDFVFETSDTAVINYLKGMRNFGDDFWIDENPLAAAPSAPTGSGGPEKVSGVKSRNELIAYLSRSKGALPETFKGMKLPDVVRHASEKFGVVFPDLTT